MKGDAFFSFLNEEARDVEPFSDLSNTVGEIEGGPNPGKDDFAGQQQLSFPVEYSGASFPPYYGEAFLLETQPEDNSVSTHHSDLPVSSFQTHAYNELARPSFWPLSSSPISESPHYFPKPVFRRFNDHNVADSGRSFYPPSAVDEEGETVYRVQFKQKIRNHLDSQHSAVSGASFSAGSYVMVETDRRGMDVGMVVSTLPLTQLLRQATVAASKGDDEYGIVQTGRIIRSATQFEVQQLALKYREEAEVIQAAQALADAQSLPVQVLDAEYQFDRQLLTIYYSAEVRVDFRGWVRDLFGRYRARVWMKQLFPSDEERLRQKYEFRRAQNIERAISGAPVRMAGWNPNGQGYIQGYGLQGLGQEQELELGRQRLGYGLEPRERIPSAVRERDVSAAHAERQLGLYPRPDARDAYQVESGFDYGNFSPGAWSSSSSHYSPHSPVAALEVGSRADAAAGAGAGAGAGAFGGSAFVPSYTEDLAPAAPSSVGSGEYGAHQGFNPSMEPAAVTETETAGAVVGTGTYPGTYTGTYTGAGAETVAAVATKTD